MAHDHVHLFGNKLGGRVGGQFRLALVILGDQFNLTPKHAAAADQHLAQTRCRRIERGGDAAHRQCEQGRLHVARVAASRQPRQGLHQHRRKGVGPQQHAPAVVFGQQGDAAAVGPGLVGLEGRGGELAAGAELLLLLKQPTVPVPAVNGALEMLTYHVRAVVEEQLEIRDSLLKLLHLLVDNISELSIDDSWLKGQVDGLLASITPPLTLRHLDEMERRMRDVLEKQGRAKARSVAAQQEMRGMLSEFIDSLAAMNQSSSAFESQIEETARQIEQVSSPEELKRLIDGVISATHAMAEESAHSREQLRSLQAKVEVTEAELIQLHQELDNASALARHDPLTDALNRKGLDEALVREISSMRRKDTPLSVSLLDIDNFKLLNDRLGHDAGDGALVHLADVTRRHIRPSDTLARYGGEEFVILMPDTALAEGVEVITRLQRELTKAIYLSGSEKVLITFSAGVAQVGADESGGDAIRRADKAMYLAKRAGKNRVFGG